MYIYCRRAQQLLKPDTCIIVDEKMANYFSKCYRGKMFICFYGITILFTTRTWFKSIVLHSPCPDICLTRISIKAVVRFDWASHKMSKVLYIDIYVLLYLPFIRPTCKAYIQNTNVYISKFYLWKRICSYWRFYQYPP